jgi:putative ubiquitin-RnfH superfamily antitoxin RatB of RatAB toxin-antitoxin module
MHPNQIEISIAFSDAKQEGCWFDCEVPTGASIRRVLSDPQIQKRLPVLEWETISVGIWGKAATLQTVLKAGDRIEIYMPLQVDPKQIRLLRAAQNPTERDKWRRKK